MPRLSLIVAIVVAWTLGTVVLWAQLNPIMMLQGKVDSNNALVISGTSGGTIPASATNTIGNLTGKVDSNNALVVNLSALSAIGGVAVVGTGVPLSVAQTATTGNVAAVTNAINYTPAAAASDYSLNGVVNVTAWTTPASFTIVVTYKDASGNARTETAAVTRGSTGAAAAAVTAVDRWYFDFPIIDIDNSATAITLSTTGTFTGSPVYNVAATLSRMK